MTQTLVASLEALLSSLLDVSKLEAGAIVATPRDFPLDTLLARIANDFAPEASDAGLVFLVLPTRRVARSDPLLLERILRNLKAIYQRDQDRNRALRVVDLLEERYAEFDGLNLTFEAREGILKHCSLANAEKLGEIGRRFLDKQQPSLEAQVANLADEIAYNNHDVDDGLRSGLISLEQLSEVQIFARHLAEVRAKYPALQGRRVVTETVRRIINTLILDLVNTTRINIENSGVQTIDEVRAAPPLAAFSPALLDEHRELKRFLLHHLYRHYKVARMSAKAGRIISDLYTAFTGDARLLPPEHQTRESLEGARAVADYIAGMTDRYAMREHRRIFAVEEIYG